MWNLKLPCFKFWSLPSTGRYLAEYVFIMIRTRYSTLWLWKRCKYRRGKGTQQTMVLFSVKLARGKWRYSEDFGSWTILLLVKMPWTISDHDNCSELIYVHPTAFLERFLLKSALKKMWVPTHLQAAAETKYRLFTQMMMMMTAHTHSLKFGLTFFQQPRKTAAAIFSICWLAAPYWNKASLQHRVQK